MTFACAEYGKMENNPISNSLHVMRARTPLVHHNVCDVPVLLTHELVQKPIETMREIGDAAGAVEVGLLA